MLGAGLFMMFAIGYVSLPERRRALRLVVVACAAVSVVYFPAFWHKSGTLAQPARAIASSISPSARDKSSDVYRQQENANLKYNIGQGGPIGKGFGIPIDYALPIVNIQDIDPDILFIPHNGVLYVLMRMGILGAIAQWSMIAAGIIAGCRLARSGDKEMAVIGTLVACGVADYALEGATDQGFYFYRIAFVVGALLGITEVARRILATRSPTPQEA